MKVLYLNVNEGKYPEVLEIEDELDTYYKLIGCDCIDIITRIWRKRRYTVICDDMGFYKPNLKVAIWDETKRDIPIVGNVVICGAGDVEGNLTSLTDEDVEILLKNVGGMYNTRTNEAYFNLFY